MAYISEETLKAIREKVNIVDVIGKRIPLTQRGKNYMGVCPFHDDHSPSMSVSPDKQIYKCFSCGAAGNVFTFIQNYENVAWNEAVAMLGDSVGIHIETGSTKKINETFKKEYEVMNLAELYFQNNLKSSYGTQAMEYLKNRGITEDIITTFGIGLSLDKSDGLKSLFDKKEYSMEMVKELGLVNQDDRDIFVRRIIFPLWDKDGQVVGFSGRIYRGEEINKYLNTRESKIFKKGELLYNYHNAKDVAKREKYILVVEGFMDAIRLSACGIKNVVALMTTSLTSNQAELLKKLRVEVVLCLDNDNAGLTGMINDGMLLQKANIPTKVILMSGAKDPDEYILKNGIEAFQNLLREPLSYFDFRLIRAKEGKDFNKPTDLAQYINEVIEILKDVDDDILKEVTINKLANDYNIDASLLKERINFEKETTLVIKENSNKMAKNKEKRNIKDEIAKKMLYYMMNDGKFINIYKKRLGFIDNEELRGLANEIMYYYANHRNINIADFISYMGDKNLNDILQEIMSLNMEENLVEEAMNEYINTYYRLMVKAQIGELKEKMAKETDINKKMEIASRIAELKKGGVDNASN